jgi:hypothetical protein
MLVSFTGTVLLQLMFSNQMLLQLLQYVDETRHRLPEIHSQNIAQSNSCTGLLKPVTNFVAYVEVLLQNKCPQ